jgi:hypothetical protein
MSTNEAEIQSGLQWNLTIDKMMADWCDQSKCFNWMHTQAYSHFSKRALTMSITTNIVISLSGIGNLIVGAVTTDATKTSIIFGCISIGVGIVNMIQDKFNWTTIASNHKQSAEKWDIITRKIEEQLAIPYSGRKDCGTFLKYIKQDINIVSETNPTIPKDIRNQCAEKFSKIKDFDIPDICGQVEHTAIYVAEPLQVPLLSNEVKDEKN